MNTYVKEVYQTIGMCFVDIINGCPYALDLLYGQKKKLNFYLMAHSIDSNVYDYCIDLLDIVIEFLKP